MLGVARETPNVAGICKFLDRGPDGTGGGGRFAFETGAEDRGEGARKLLSSLIEAREGSFRRRGSSVLFESTGMSSRRRGDGGCEPSSTLTGGMRGSSGRRYDKGRESSSSTFTLTVDVEAASRGDKRCESSSTLIEGVETGSPVFGESCRCVTSPGDCRVGRR
jgi:hypothetical protein